MTVTEWIAVPMAAAGNLTAIGGGGGADVHPDASQIGPGSLGFWVVIGLLVVLFFLYRSMRKQVRRVDFDTGATTDEERVASHHEPDERAGRDQEHDEKRDQKSDETHNHKHDHSS